MCGLDCFRLIARPAKVSVMPRALDEWQASRAVPASPARSRIATGAVRGTMIVVPLPEFVRGDSNLRIGTSAAGTASERLRGFVCGCDSFSALRLASRGSVPGHREVLHLVQRQRAAPDRLAVAAQVRKASKQRRQRDLAVQPGKGRAEAEVAARREREVVVRVAVGVEAVRIPRTPLGRGWRASGTRAGARGRRSGSPLGPRPRRAPT
jgi:hypothetical protein